MAEIFDIEPGIFDVTLCTKHYKIVHRHIHSNDNMYYPIVKCKMYQALIHGTVRHCADKVTLEAYYHELGCEITIEEHNKICTSCYNHQLQIIKVSEDYSRDEELQVVIDNLHISVEEDTYDDYILKALIHTLKLLGKALMKKMAALFPDIYDTFVQCALKAAENNIELEQTVTTNLPKNCLLTKIITVFGKHVICDCQQLSHGLVLYRRGVNPLKTLSNTLTFFRKQSVIIFAELNENTNESMTQVSNEVNTLIHKECDRILQEDAHAPYDISSFDPDLFMNQINPTLWNFIIKITKGKWNTSMTHEKKLSCIYSLCVLTFCTNRKYSMPLHVLLTDIIDSLSGSNELIRILNNFGAVASVDTHKRYVQHQIERRLRVNAVETSGCTACTVVPCQLRLWSPQ